MQCFNHHRHLKLSHISCGPDRHSAEGLARCPDARLCHPQIELAMGATVLRPMRVLVAPSADVAREMERLPSDLMGVSLHTRSSPALHSYHAPVVRAASSPHNQL